MVIFKDFTAAYADPLVPLTRSGYVRIESIPSTVMDINFPIA